MGKGPSDSVDWKSYAFDLYRLDIRTPAGVRDIVRKLDLADVELSSIRKVIDDVRNLASAPQRNLAPDSDTAQPPDDSISNFPLSRPGSQDQRLDGCQLAQ